MQFVLSAIELHKQVYYGAEKFIIPVSTKSNSTAPQTTPYKMIIHFNQWLSQTVTTKIEHY